MKKMSPHACAVIIEYRFNLNYKSIESQKCDQFSSNLWICKTVIFVLTERILSQSYINNFYMHVIKI